MAGRENPMNRRLRKLLIAYTVLLSVSAAGYAMIEGRDIATSLWWGITTATTTGYGDEFPKTIAGRAIGASLMQVMAFLVSPLLQAAITAKYIVDSDAWTHAEQEGMKASLGRIEAQLDAMQKGSI